MKYKKILAVVLSVLSVFSCSIPVSSSAWGSIGTDMSIEEMEKSVGEQYGQNYKE